MNKEIEPLHSKCNLRRKLKKHAIYSDESRILLNPLGSAENCE